MNIEAKQKQKGRARAKRGIIKNRSKVWAQYFFQEQSKATANTEFPTFKQSTERSGGHQRELSWVESSAAPIDDQDAQCDSNTRYRWNEETSERPILTGREADKSDATHEQSHLPHLEEQRRRIEKAKAQQQVPARIMPDKPTARKFSKQ